MKHKKRSHTPKKLNFAALAGWIIGCELVGIIASSVTITNISSWYIFLQKPSFSPPSWLFGPVWTILYALMGIAAYRITTKGVHTPYVRTTIALFGLQLFFNFIWSFIFFGSHNIPGAFVDISILWIILCLLVKRFEKIDSLAAYMMIPYVAWVSFAMILNYYLWLLNA